MKYYKVEYSDDRSVVGSQYPQVYDFIKGYNPKPEAHGLFSLYYDDNPFPENVDLSGLKLANGANYTDFLCGGFSNDLFLFNEKAKSLLNILNIDREYKIYPAKVISLRKKMEKEYFMMKNLSNNFENVDFEKSHIIHKVNDKNIPIKISSSGEFMTKFRDPKDADNWDITFSFLKIKMKKEFYDLKLDLFQIGGIDFLWYASHKFVKTIEDNRLTGLKFEEVEL